MKSAARVYGGVDADHRVSERRSKLIAAGLQLLGSPDSPVVLTIRAVCSEAGLGARYFYESFDDSDALVIAVYEHVIDDVVTSTLTALEASDAKPGSNERGQIEAGLRTIVSVVADDPRRGRVLFDAAVAHSALAKKRVEAAGMFGDLLAVQAQSFYGIEATEALRTMSRFLVGGFGETLTAWQHGELDLTQGELVQVCADLFQSSANTLLSKARHA